MTGARLGRTCGWRTWFAGALLCLAATALTSSPAAAAGRDPVRLLVITNIGQLLPQALEAFEKAYGRELVTLEVATEDVAPERLREADVIVAYFLRNPTEQRLAAEVASARRRGAVVLAAPADTAERNWNMRFDPKVVEPLKQYWTQGGVENMTAFLAYAYNAAGGARKLRVPPPIVLVDRGIYHPRAATPFPSLRAYLEWYRAQRVVPSTAPLVGLTFFGTNWKFHDLDHIDAFISAFEKRGIGVVAAFDWPLGAMGDLLSVDGVSPLKTLFVLNQSMASRPEDAQLLEKLGVHTINLMVTRQSRADWEQDPRGIPLDRIRNVLELPESAGASEPTLFATSETVSGIATPVSRAVPERLGALVDRAARWIALQDKPNAKKRVALIYYNNPPGRGNVGASYLNVYPSLTRILERLRDEGYMLGRVLPDERRLSELLERNGRNIELWGPGDLHDMVASGAVQLVSMAQYKSWFAELPKRYRDATVARWGRPEQSTLMTVTGDDGQRYFVVPGVQIGNVFLGPQPLRQTFEEAQNSAHDPETPVPHQYVAAYLWYRHQFGADAIVHVGRHGTLEWLPGKQAGQAGWDASEVLLGDMPNPYIYIMDGGGEAIQAERRSGAVIVGHLTPMVVEAGKLADFQPLHDALENMEKTEGSADLAAEYQRSALAEIRRLKLDAQLGLALDTTPWEDIESRVHRFLHDTETDTVPLGLHTLGETPPEPNQREGLQAFIRYNFDDSEVGAIAAELPSWADAIDAGIEPTVTGPFPKPLGEKVARTLRDARTWLADLRTSAPRELDGLVRVLSGHYLPTAPLGDPLRVPAGLPTGRNLHTSDGALIPTKAAWAVGQKMAAEFVARYRKEHKRFPEKISLVLFYGETSRHQGAFESMALSLLGIEPVWNARGVVDGVTLIPDAQLGRPRVDVLFTISGIYRDGFPDKVGLLDKAVRLAAGAGDNAVSRHDAEVAASLRASGVSAEQAAQVGRARIFGNKPSSYGNGVGSLVEQSKDADGHTGDLATAYLHSMGYAFSSEGWGVGVTGGLASHLKGNEAVVFSRANVVNGALDNDDTYQYFGGLGVASKTVNDTPPDMFINNLRKPGSESVTDLKSWLSAELHTRNWNQKWLKEMQRSGYAGAREMAKGMEYLYGFQATTAEEVDGSFWQGSYDVLVQDKYGLGLDDFFRNQNPYAQQSILARMLEVDRQGSYKFSDADRATLVQKYVASVAEFGISCSANTCGNLKVNQYVAEQSGQVPGLSGDQLKRFGQRVARATGWTPKEFTAAPEAMQAGVRAAAAAPPTAVPVRRAQAPASAAAPEPKQTLTGYQMQERLLRAAATSISVPIPFWPFVPVGAALLLGAVAEVYRRRESFITQ